VDQSALTTKDTYDLGSARLLPTAPRRKGRTFEGPRGDRANWELTHLAQVADDRPLGFGRERGLDFALSWGGLTHGNDSSCMLGRNSGMDASRRCTWGVHRVGTRPRREGGGQC
jgi:hypothetical protein